MITEEVIDMQKSKLLQEVRQMRFSEASSVRSNSVYKLPFWRIDTENERCGADIPLAALGLDRGGNDSPINHPDHSIKA